MTGSRLLDLQPQTVTALEIAGGIVRAAPLPSRLKSQRDHGFDDLGAQDVRNERLAERSIGDLRDYLGGAE